jgi:hypothetical protein
MISMTETSFTGGEMKLSVGDHIEMIKIQKPQSQNINNNNPMIRQYQHQQQQQQQLKNQSNFNYTQNSDYIKNFETIF